MKKTVKYKEYDKKILSHIDEFGFISVKQCASTYYQGHKYPISESNRKLKAMCDKGWLKRCKDVMSNQYLYYTNLERQPSMSDILLMDFYSEMVNNKAEILEFNREVMWKSTIVNVKPMRSDGFMVYRYDGEIYAVLIEVNVTHTYDLENYEKLYDAKEVQHLLGAEDDYFPPVVVITKRLKPPEHNGKVKVIYLNYEMDNLLKKVLMV